MRDDIQVYKTFGKQEYVLHTTITNNSMIAVVKWYIRERPYVGSTKYTITYEGEEAEVPMIKSRGVAKTMELRMSYFKSQMEKHIDANQKQKDLVNKANENAVKAHDEAMIKMARMGAYNEDMNRNVKQATANMPLTVEDVLPSSESIKSQIVVSDVEEEVDG